MEVFNIKIFEINKLIIVKINKKNLNLFFLSSFTGASTSILTTGSYSKSDESWDHPKAAGSKLWPIWEHQQLSQPVCAATHQCKVKLLLFSLCFSTLFSGLISKLDYFLVLIEPCLPLSYILYLLFNFYSSFLPNPFLFVWSFILLHFLFFLMHFYFS